MIPRDVGAFIHPEHAFDGTSIVAAGSGDNTLITGRTIDRLALNDRYLSGKLCIPFTATLAAAATLKLTVKLQDGNASNMSDAADYGTVVTAQTVATGPGGGGTVKGCFELDVDLSAAKRYIRALVTPDLSAGATDTAVIGGGVLLLGGGNATPAL